MFKSVLRKGGLVKTWGSCAETRGVSKEEIIDGIEISGMADYSDWVLSADKVLTF